ncbi:MAG: zf-HC2 domain-containing protein [Deltaproteobacteria bacterium]|nr:zf-HC2 domain-containing protein [Deltaproteobacteria bacterium]
MKCEDHISLIVDAVEGTITAKNRRMLDAHLAECSTCRAALAELESAAPLVETLQTASATARVSEGFDEKVREAVARAAASRERRGIMWWAPRLAATVVAAALAAVAVHTAVTWDGPNRMGVGVDETLLSVFTSGSADEPETSEEAEAVAEGMFGKVFREDEIAVLEAMLDGDLDDEILEMDEASLKAFEKSLEESQKANKSG